MEFLDQVSGFLLGEHFAWSVLGSLLLFVFIAYMGFPFILWTVAIYAALLGFSAPIWMIFAFTVMAVIFNTPPLRRMLVSGPLLNAMKPIMPKISDTEKTALEAGVVWREADLFSGKPDMDRLMAEPYPELTEEEQAFIDGPVDKLCSLIDDFRVWKERTLSDETMDYIKKERFLGMIIPKEYGGLGFSALAHSEVVQKLSSHSITAGITVMVPNSLGPAELLIHYGTQAQKDKYLRKLAVGEEIPCFGLTEPMAGSDAGAITSTGDLFKGDDGQLQIRLNWQKRWITLSPISTIIGLAFRLRDPENLLGKGEDLGITCALIPSNTEGVWIGHRHDPMGLPFNNGPTEGKDVVVNAEDAIIGGVANAGKGWTMLMESLAAGRGISLPAQSTGGVKLCYRVLSAHSNIRKQFGVPIGKFEGVEEPLARVAGMVYYLEAMRKYTISALDQGIKPPVVTAMTKYNATEMSRKAAMDAMDVLGGQALSMGPRNTIAIPYLGMPIAVTVEGANILTRTLIVFGQGALRAHPYAYKEVDAVMSGDVKAFDQAFWGHIGHVTRNMARSVVLSMTRGYLSGRGYGKGMGRYFQKLAWASASFAIMADFAMGLLGGKLKVKEKLTGRFADVLSWLFIATAILRRFKAEGYRKEDAPFAHYALQVAFSELQKSFDGIFDNFDVPLLGWFFKGPLRWWSGLNGLGVQPKDQLGHDVVSAMLAHTEQRERFTTGTYVPKDPETGLGRLEQAFHAVKKAEAIERKIRKAVKSKQLPKGRVPALIDKAVAKGVISVDEKVQIENAEKLRWDAIQVDDFGGEAYTAPTVMPYKREVTVKN